MNRTIRVAILMGAAAVLGAVPVFASGFAIYEHSAKASGQAGAWTARADDAAANWYNPAAMVWHKGFQVQFGINYITIGSNSTVTTNESVLAGTPFATPVGVEYEGKENDVTPIHLYFTQGINDRFAWGIGINNPFGLVTEWKDKPMIWSSKKADLETWVANANFAFRVAESFSLAVGADYMKAKIKSFSKDIPWIIVNPALAAAPDGTSNLTGDGDGWGWNVAASWKKDNWALGLTYRSALKPKIDGDVTFTGVPAAVAALFPSGPATATVNLPAQVSLGAACTAVKSWEFEFDLGWAQWSSFERLNVDIQNNTAGVQDISQREDWKDTWTFRFGANWKITDAHQFRFGALYDQNPIPNDTLRPSIPDGDRTSVTLGYGYVAKTWGIDLYYMPLWFASRTAERAANESFFTSGVLNADYKNFVHLAGATFNFKF